MKGRLGTKLRGLRRRKGLTQTDVASRLGISPSYLNLIEHDQRQLPANLLIKAAEILNVELAAFSDDSQNRLAADLQEVFGDPLFEEHALTTADLRELADNPAASRAVIALYHAGLSFLLVPMDQPGVEVKPLVQITGDAEFNEVFFTDARTARDNVLGGVNNGWKVAMGTLGFERGTAFLASQLRFEHELRQTVELAAKHGATSDPVVRQRLADAYIGLEVLRFNRLRAFTAMSKSSDGQPGPEASINKLQWSNWHRRLGELQMDIMGPWSQVVGDGYHLDELQLTFLFSRSETIYAGSSEIQRNIIGERVLGLPREPAVA